MKKEQSAVMACVGAVIGAGFASGREVVAFFTQYGQYAQWLILLSALVMTGLCFLCMRAARQNECPEGWYSLLNGSRMPFFCSMALMVLTAGAMIAAGGQVAALLWNHPQAYIVGVWGTIAAAMLMSHGSLKPLGLISAALSMLLLCALMSACVRPGQPLVRIAKPSNIGWAAAKAVGYAGMNMMLAIGVVCRSAGRTPKPGVTSALFGWIIGMLLMISQYVYASHPEVQASAFPMIMLLSGFGRTGYVTGAVILYLAMMTTLVSVLYALRTAAERMCRRQELRWLMVPGLPLAISGFGFSAIVDRLYAPAGWLCLLFVFLPLAIRQWKTAKKPTSS